jgi:hypothetical protein
LHLGVQELVAKGAGRERLTARVGDLTPPPLPPTDALMVRQRLAQGLELWRELFDPRPGCGAAAAEHPAAGQITTVGGQPSDPRRSISRTNRAVLGPPELCRRAKANDSRSSAFARRRIVGALHDSAGRAEQKAVTIAIHTPTLPGPFRDHLARRRSRARRSTGQGD